EARQRSLLLRPSQDDGATNRFSVESAPLIPTPCAGRRFPPPSPLTRPPRHCSTRRRSRRYKRKSRPSCSSPCDEPAARLSPSVGQSARLGAGRQRSLSMNLADDCLHSGRGSESALG